MLVNLMVDHAVKLEGVNLMLFGRFVHKIFYLGIHYVVSAIAIARVNDYRLNCLQALRLPLHYCKVQFLVL